MFALLAMSTTTRRKARACDESHMTHSCCYFRHMWPFRHTRLTIWQNDSFLTFWQNWGSGLDRMANGENPQADRPGERGRRILVSRSTKRPRAKAPDGTHQAVALIRRLSNAEFRERAALTEEQLETLDDIASGRPPRNAVAIIHAIELKCGYAYGKPAQAVEINGKLSLEQLLLEATGAVEVLPPGPCPSDELVEESIPIPDRVVEARPPIVRKNRSSSSMVERSEPSEGSDSGSTEIVAPVASLEVST